MSITLASAQRYSNFSLQNRDKSKIVNASGGGDGIISIMGQH
jgi:hypothetical protein